MKLYTRKGDDGQTQLGSGGRVGKEHPRVGAYGEVDELNAAVGLARAGCTDAELAEKLSRVQECLFVVGAELADPERGPRTPTLSAAESAELESWIDQAAAGVAALKHFVLPGGCELAARLHLARTICRRAERVVVGLAGIEDVGPATVVYLNRLSDLLFAWARLANTQAGVQDTVWHPPTSAKEG
ncbi:MAG: cob(I)yrinic acid a,c-diamide adenosyltransferase [Phycisphaerae bacterium]